MYDIVNLLGTFSLTKAHLKLGKLNCVQLQVTLHQAKFSASYKRDLATKGFAFGNHKLLKKLDQNFYFCLHRLGAAR